MRKRSKILVLTVQITFISVWSFVASRFNSFVYFLFVYLMGTCLCFLCPNHIIAKVTLNRDGGGSIFHLETTMVSVLHKELGYKVEKLNYKTF